MSYLLLLASALSAYAGFACLALAMPEHAQRIRIALSPRKLRPIGACMLALAYLACIARDGASFGTLLWGVLISLAAFAVALTLSFRRPLSRGSSG